MEQNYWDTRTDIFRKCFLEEMLHTENIFKEKIDDCWIFEDEGDVLVINERTFKITDCSNMKEAYDICLDRIGDKGLQEKLKL